MNNPTGWFDRVNAELRGLGVGRPVMLLDLDSLDKNLRLISQRLSHRYRIVTKSLPSRELISYVMEATGSSRLMAFHLPFVRWLVHEYPASDILLGKPFLVPAAEELLDGVDETTRHTVCSNVQWLIDTPARLAEYLDLATRRGLQLRVNIEIDVGLHRGGVSEAEMLDAMLDTIAANPARLVFSGFMGYEAQVPFMPDPDRAFDDAMVRYDDFVAYGRARFPGLFGGNLTFNSGGSKTYPRFHDGLVVNDVAAGSAALKPSTFDILADHGAAQYIAAPVIRKFPRVSRREVDPAKAMSLYLYGGGWAAELVHPVGVTISAHADPPNQNLLPNQCLFETSLDTPLTMGDFVFFQPQQGDAMVQFEEILVLRDARVVDRWRPFPLRY